MRLTAPGALLCVRFEVERLSAALCRLNRALKTLFEVS